MSDDPIRDLAIKQGYVPEKCDLNGTIVMLLVNEGTDPCAGCNVERSVCGGRPKS